MDQTLSLPARRSPEPGYLIGLPTPASRELLLTPQSPTLLLQAALPPPEDVSPCAPCQPSQDHMVCGGMDAHWTGRGQGQSASPSPPPRPQGSQGGELARAACWFRSPLPGFAV